MNGMNIGRELFWKLLKKALRVEVEELPPKLQIRITRREEEGTDTYFDVFSNGVLFCKGLHTECYQTVEVWGLNNKTGSK